MTHTEALERTLDALHKISVAVTSRQLAQRPHITGKLRESLESKVLSDTEIADLAIGVWSTVVIEVEPKLSETTIFECSPDEGTHAQGVPQKESE